MENKVVTTKITATSRTAIKRRDNYYTVEASEERTILDCDNVDVAEEWRKLFDSVNAIIDEEVDAIYEATSNK